MLISEQILQIHSSASYDALDFSGFPATPIQIDNGNFFQIGDIYHYFKNPSSKPQSFKFQECGRFCQMITLSENVGFFKSRHSVDVYCFTDLFHRKQRPLFSFSGTPSLTRLRLDEYHFLYKDGCLVYGVNDFGLVENDPFTHLIDTNGRQWQLPIALSPIYLEKVQGGYLLDATDTEHPLTFIFNKDPVFNFKGKRFFLSENKHSFTYLGEFPISATKKFSFYQNTEVSEDNFVFFRNEHVTIHSYHVADYQDDMRLINLQCFGNNRETSTLSCFLSPAEWNKLTILADSLHQENITIQDWTTKLFSQAHTLFDGNVYIFN